MAFGEGEESPTDHSRQGGFGRGMRIATGAERPRNDMVFTRGAVQDRRATARVAPTEGYKECVGWVSALAEVF